MDNSRQRRPTLLIVDDTPENLDVLKEALKSDYVVRVANSGALALHVLDTVSPLPDLILLDIVMGGMDGYEVLKAVRANPETRDIPVVFVSSLADETDELKGLSLGAADYISKPFSVPIVRARIHTHLALSLARQTIARQNELLLAERRLIEDVIARIRDDPAFDTRKLRYLVSSVDRTNGDMLFSAFTPDGRQWVLVGDIAGHGPAAAIGVPLISQIFYRLAGEGGEAGALLEELNSVMLKRLPAQIFMPFGFVELAADRRRMRVANGGLPGCLVRQDVGNWCPLECTSMPLGIQASFSLGDSLVDCLFVEPAIVPGDCCWLFTDGLTEIASPDGKLLGTEGAIRLLDTLSPGSDLDALWPLLDVFSGGEGARDDLTLVEIRV